MRRAISETRIDELRSIGLFSRCSDKELARVEALVDDIEVEAGKVLTREGRLGLEVFVIVEGQASVTVRGERIAELGPGDFFGEMALLARRPLRVATVRAQSPMRLLVVEPRAFASLLEIGSIALKSLRAVVERLSIVEGAPA